jgi:hypothetical protein
MILANLPQAITAIGGLGTAAFGLLEAIKPVFPGINHMGFGRIRTTISSLTPSEPGAHPPLNALPQSNVLDSLLANWVNGTDLNSQKSIAKSLIKLHLSAGNAPALAAATNVDPALLSEVARSIASSTALTQPQSDAYSRFDLIVTAMLDEAYQHADQVYRNSTRGLAALLAVALAFAGGLSLAGSAGGLDLAGSLKVFWWKPDMFLSLLIGLLATPLAPIAKDISSALSTAVNTMQAIKK